MENKRNNVVFKIFLIFVISILLFTLIPVNIYATNNNDDLYIDGHKILTIYYGDPGSNARIYSDPGPFSFYRRL